MSVAHRWWRGGLAIVVAGLLAGCGPAAQGSPSPILTASPSPASAESSTPQAPPTQAPPTIDGPSYSNPVYERDFPDPHVIAVDGTYYAYSTNVGTQNVPVISSADLATWERLGDAMPALPAWASPSFGNTWAPGVIQIDQTFVLYFVARDTESDKQCIGVATAESPDGPFRDRSDEPFICQDDMGGSIDAYPFADEDGQLYVYWKNDGNCCGLPVALWGQTLADDGLERTGEPVELVQRDQRWEIPLIENPAMVQHDDAYYLFYSGNWWEGPDYAVGYALCETALGPCQKPQDEPIFEFTPQATGPGGQALFTDFDGDLVMAYHAWEGANIGYPEGRRSLRIEPVVFEDGRPVIEGPTVDPQPLP